MSLDGYIAGPGDEFDWIPMDPDIDFGEIFSKFDTLVMGRRTFEVTKGAGPGLPKGMQVFVFSRTLNPSDYPNVTIVADKPEETIAELRSKPGKDIWLFGGGELFRSLAGAKLVDTVEVAVVPVLLGGGIPLLPPPSDRITLKLESHKAYKTGIMSLSYVIA